MARTNSEAESWLISPKRFVKLVGAEYEMLRTAGGSVLQRFYMAAVLIVLISLFSFVSIGYAIELLFHSYWAEVLLGSFISLLFLLMYVFLINTFTKSRENDRAFNVSNVTRMGFVVFMGFILSKPVETWLMKDKLDAAVVLHKQQLSASLEKQIRSSYDKEMMALQRRIDLLQQMSAGGTIQFNSEMTLLNERLNVLQQKVTNLLMAAKLKIDRSDFLVYRVQQAMRYVPSWIFCFCMIGLFALPGLLIYSLSRDNVYFRLKQEYEKGLITAGYENFCDRYNVIFQSTFGKDIRFYTCYTDPPFNTCRPEERFKKSEDFFDKYFHAS